MGLYKANPIVLQVVRKFAVTINDTYRVHDIHHKLPPMEAEHFGTCFYNMIKDKYSSQIPSLISHLILKKTEVHFLPIDD